MENIVLGLARFVLRVPGCVSLKEKRMVVRKVKDRLRARHEVSVAEVGAQDEHQRAILAIGMVGSDARALGESLRALLREVERMSVAPIVEERVELVTYGDSLSEPFIETPDRW